MKERREARCDDRACVTVTDPEGKQQEWERRLQKSESQHLPTIIVIELGVGSLAKHMRGCLRGTGAHWCYSKGKKNESICSWSSLAKSKPGFEFPTSLPVFHLSVVCGSRPLCDLSFA